MKRTRVTVKCVADNYAAKERERIVEFFDPTLKAGGLISFYRTDDGKLQVTIYRHDANVEVCGLSYNGPLPLASSTLPFPSTDVRPEC